MSLSPLLSNIRIHHGTKRKFLEGSKIKQSQSVQKQKELKNYFIFSTPTNFFPENFFSINTFLE